MLPTEVFLCLFYLPAALFHFPFISRVFKETDHGIISAFDNEPQPIKIIAEKHSIYNATDKSYRNSRQKSSENADDIAEPFKNKKINSSGIKRKFNNKNQNCAFKDFSFGKFG